MRTTSSAPLALILSSLVSLAEAGPCGYGLTCIMPPYGWEQPCTPNATAEFQLVAPLLTKCDSLTSYFNRDVWDSAATPKYCDVASPCGLLAPYIKNTEPYFRLCADYKQFRFVLYTFRGYCSGQPVASLPGDNGLLVSLKNAPSPPPAPTTLPPTAPPVATTKAPPPITAAPTTAAPTTTVPAPTTPGPTTVAPTANGSGSASAASGVSDGESSIVNPPVATSSKPPAPVVPSATKPLPSSSSATSRYITASHAIGLSAVATAMVVWVGGPSL